MGSIQTVSSHLSKNMPRIRFTLYSLVRDIIPYEVQKAKTFGLDLCRQWYISRKPD